MGQEKEKEKILLLEKGKSGLLKFLFGRATITVLLLLAQLATLILFFGWLERYVLYLFGFHVVLSALLAITVMNRPMNPVFQLSWTVFVVLLPVVGGMLYLIFALRLGSRAINRRLMNLRKETDSLVSQEDAVIQAFRAEDPEAAGLSEYVRNTGAFPVYRNGGVTYFPSGEAKFEDLINCLERAEKFIFLEYFIVAEGYMWGRILKILEEKARAGVEIRMIYDGLCSVTHLPVNYPKQLAKLGIKCKIFSRLRPIFSTSYNNRDHRKILVVDGRVGFTGGVNLADEYINHKMRFGHWKDTAIKVEGEPVNSLTLMFLQMWNIDEHIRDRYEDYMIKEFGQAAADHSGNGYVQPFSDNPFDGEQVGKRVYLDIINHATSCVNIMTPYLVLDYEMMHALTYASKRGVRVSIIMPHIPDKKYVFAVSKTYYEELLAAGVHIYEYTPGFVHAKVITADGKRSVVGTVNFDYRSFYLHFECGVYLHNVPQIAEIEEDFHETMARSEEITPENHKRSWFFTKVVGALLKIFAPLM